MKKLFILIFVLFNFFANAQNKPDWEYDFNRPVGAFFPNYFPMGTNKYMPSQNTFYEYNWVSNNLNRLIKQNLNLNRGSDIDKDVYIINNYSTPAGRVLDNLSIKYNIFQVYGLYVVSSIEVTGSKIQVAKLFIYLYNNDIQSSNLRNGFVKTFAQDNAVYKYVNGLASIKIANVVYKNKNEFKVDFDKLKENFKKELMLVRLAEEQERIEAVENDIKRKTQYKQDSINRKLENLKAHERREQIELAKPKKSINVYFFSKSKKKLEFRNEPSPEVENLILEKVMEYKNGNYSAYVVTTSVLGVKTFEIKINPNDR